MKVRLDNKGEIRMRISVNCLGSIVDAEVIEDNLNGLPRDLRYICTDFEATHNGNDVTADVYEDKYTGELFAVIA